MTKIPSWFTEWRDNEFHSLSKSVSYIKGQLVVMVPLSIATLGGVIYLMVR